MARVSALLLGSGKTGREYVCNLVSTSSLQGFPGQLTCSSYVSPVAVIQSMEKKMQTGLSHLCNYKVKTVMMIGARTAEIPGVSSNTLVTPSTGSRYPFKYWKDADWRPLSTDSGVWKALSQGPL